MVTFGPHQSAFRPFVKRPQVSIYSKIYHGIRRVVTRIWNFLRSVFSCCFCTGKKIHRPTVAGPMPRPIPRSGQIRPENLLAFLIRERQKIINEQRRDPELILKKLRGDTQSLFRKQLLAMKKTKGTKETIETLLFVLDDAEKEPDLAMARNQLRFIGSMIVDLQQEKTPYKDDIDLPPEDHLKTYKCSLKKCWYRASQACRYSLSVEAFFWKRMFLKKSPK